MTNVKIRFTDLKSSLKDTVLNKVDDYDYGGGFDCEEIEIEDSGSDLEINFVSEKSFTLNIDDQSEEYDEDLFFTFLERGQFFSSLFFEDPEYFESADIKLEIMGKTYQVLLSKDPSLKEL